MVDSYYSFNLTLFLCQSQPMDVYFCVLCITTIIAIIYMSFVGKGKTKTTTYEDNLD